MKKILLGLSILLLSCGQKTNVYTYDGCEYITIVDGGNGKGLAHKGNCKNKIHKKWTKNI